MDLELTPSKSGDDTEIDTPPHTISPQSTKPLSYTNGAFKHHHHHNSAAPAVAYKECMKNHAAAIGGHAVDGCGEFMPPPPSSAASLKCAACGCHRNFHRRHPDVPAAAVITPPFLDFRHPNLSSRTSLSPSPPPPQPNFLFTLSTAAAAEEHHHDPVTPTAEVNPTGRKRFRTKFTLEQKEKMRSFSEKLGWKMMKADEDEVKDFCDEIGVEKGVLKVWMHNNKSKKEIINGGLICFDQSSS